MNEALKLDITLEKIPEAQKSVLRQLIELYEYEFTEFYHNDVNEHGYFGYKYLDHYWTEEGRFPFFIKVNGKLAGFVLVNNYCYLIKDSTARSIAEFFVIRKYQRKGVGRVVARQVFDMFNASFSY